MKKSLYSSKDQSYVLYSMTQEQLAHTFFPLGNLRKTEVRKIAEENGFVNAHKRDSQDICFVQNGTYVDFIERYTRKIYHGGDFIDLNGNVIGRHNGIIHYTIGQRKGLGVSAPNPLYVCEIDSENNTVKLVSNMDLFINEVTAEQVNLISVPFLEGKRRLKIRYQHMEQ